MADIATLHRFRDYYMMSRDRGEPWGVLARIFVLARTTDADVEFCIQTALDTSDYEGGALACILRPMSRHERKRFGDRALNVIHQKKRGRKPNADKSPNGRAKHARAGISDGA